MNIHKGKDGRLKITEGKGTRLYWSPSKLETLKRKYPITKNEDLAAELEVSLRTLVRKARELGLKKDPQWQHEMTMKNCRIAHTINRLHPNKGCEIFIEKGRPYRFRKGQTPMAISPESRKLAGVRRTATMRENARREKAGLPKLVFHSKRQRMNFYKMMGV